MQKLRPYALILGMFAIAIVIAFVMSRKRTPEPTNDATFDPTTPDARPPPSASAVASSKSPYAPITQLERREAHSHIEHELCENGAKVINRLNGRVDTDPAEIGILSNCLKYGNVAWYKCILTAKTADEAKTCSARLLRPVQYLDD